MYLSIAVVSDTNVPSYQPSSNEFASPVRQSSGRDPLYIDVKPGIGTGYQGTVNGYPPQSSQPPQPAQVQQNPPHTPVSVAQYYTASEKTNETMKQPRTPEQRPSPPSINNNNNNTNNNNNNLPGQSKVKTESGAPNGPHLLVPKTEAGCRAATPTGPPQARQGFESYLSQDSNSSSVSSMETMGTRSLHMMSHPHHPVPVMNTGKI